MRRFKNWLRNWFNRENSEEMGLIHKARIYDSLDQSERCVRFNVYFAQGGRIVETFRVDRQKDREHRGLYVITPDREFGNEIDKIITMELLK